MPVVPEVLPGRAAPAFDSARGASPAAFGADIGAGVNNFGRAVSAYGEHLQALREQEDKLWVEDELNQFSADWTAIEARSRREVLATPDAYTDSQRYVEQQWDTASGAFIERVQRSRQLTPAMAQGLRSRINAMQAAAGLEAVNLETDRVTRSTAMKVGRRIDMATNEVISTPGLWESRKESIRAFIEQNAAALGETTQETLEQAEAAMDAAHISGRIKEDPQAVLSDLHSGIYDDVIDPDTKQKGISAAYREIEDRVAAADRADAREQRNLQRRQHEAFGDALVRIAANDMTQEQLAELLARDVISPEDYRVAQTDLRRAASDDGNAALELDLRIDVLNGEATLGDLLSHRDELSTDEMTRLVDLADQVARRGGALAREDVQQSMDIIRSFVGGVRGPLAVLDQEASAREARALEEFTTRLAPDGSNQRALREEVIQNFRRPTALPSVFDAPVSRYLPRSGQMNSNPELLRSAIRDAMEQLAEDRTAGLITPEEADYEVRVLGQYTQELRRMTPPPTLAPLAE